MFTRLLIRGPYTQRKMSDPIDIRVMEESVSLSSLSLKGNSMSSSRTKSGQFTKDKEAEILKVASELTVDGTLKGLAEFSSNCSTILANLGAKFQDELQKFQTVQKATELAKEEATRIHGVEAIAKSLEEAKADSETNRKRLGAEDLEYRIGLQKTLETFKADINRETADLRLTQSREKEKWSFEFEVEKRYVRSTFDEEMRQTRLKESIRTEELERKWAAREVELTAREKELQDLRTKVDGIEAEIKAAVAMETSIVGNSMKKDKDHEIQLLRNEFAAARTVSENTISTLRAEMKAVEEHAANLSTQLVEANKKVETIAMKALEAASGRQALADVQMLNQNPGNGASARKT